MRRRKEKKKHPHTYIHKLCHKQYFGLLPFVHWDNYCYKSVATFANICFGYLAHHLPTSLSPSLCPHSFMFTVFSKRIWRLNEWINLFFSVADCCPILSPPPELPTFVPSKCSVRANTSPQGIPPCHLVQNVYLLNYKCDHESVCAIVRTVRSTSVKAQHNLCLSRWWRPPK